MRIEIWKWALVNVFDVNDSVDTILLGLKGSHELNIGKKSLITNFATARVGATYANN